MESPKATSLLNEILQKLSLLTKEEATEEVVLSEEVEVTEEETPEVAEATKELAEAPEEITEEVVEEEAALEAGYVTEEAFATKVSEMEAELAAIKSMVQEQMSSLVQEKEDLSSQVEKLSADLASEPAAEPIKHDPETSGEKKQVFSYGQNRPSGTLDRVFNRLNNK